MSEVKINANITGDQLIIREGAAAPVMYPKDINLVTNIDGPGDWFTGKRVQYDWNHAHILVNSEDSSIVLFHGEHENHGTVRIEGRLQKNKDLEAFRINDLKNTWTGKQLSSFLKMRRVFFADPEENMQVVKSLEDLKIKVTQEIEQKNDFKGNKKAHFEQNLDTGIKIWFVLKIPVFKDAEPSTFRVDINFDVTDGNSYFWLESVELKELEYREATAALKAEIDRFNDVVTVLYI